LQDASLDNGDLEEEALFWLHNPPEHELEIEDPDEIFFLEQFLATQNSSQETYAKICQSHNKRHPE
ncbi:hypothetical protein K439DRAFT_1298412, partial [Ramaria rubella]